MLNSYDSKRYTVITKDMLLRLANEQQSRRKRRRNIKSFDKIEEIRLEYLNILQIDCLWPLSNLVRLKLNNNVIEKIENLEKLKNLCELDLSFNCIKKIENLEELKNIHILSFYSNEIEVIEGIDHMENLAILSIGKNKIADWDHPQYLRNMKELKSLQMTGNPCAEKDGYFSYLIAFVPQLVYYGYRMITKQEHIEASEKHIRLVTELNEAEAKKNIKLKEQKEIEKSVAQLTIAYVEHLDEDNFFNMMFEKDEDGKNFAGLNSDTEGLLKHYKESFCEVCHQLKDLGLEEDKRRRAEVQAITSVIEDTLTKVTNRARILLDSVDSKRAEITMRVLQLVREAAILAEETELEDDLMDNIDKLAKELSEEFSEYANKIWAKLMEAETISHEQIEEMILMFETNFNDLVNGFLESAQEYFTQLRSLEADYSENLMPIAMNIIISVEDEDKTPFLEAMTEDKDAFTGALTGSNFLHLQIIDDRQDTMVKRLKDWQSKFVTNLKETENKRCRDRILEITHFLDHHIKNATVDKLLGQQALQIEQEEKEKDKEKDERDKESVDAGGDDEPEPNGDENE